MREFFLVLRFTHILAAVVFLGGIFLYYFLLRPTLNRIPQAHAAVVSQRLGWLFSVTVLITLGLLAASGVLRLYYMGMLDDALTGQFYATAYGRWMGIMLLSWLVATVDALIMIFILRPRVIAKYPPTTNPTRSEVIQRRQWQFRLSTWMDWLQLVGFISGAVALLAGVSLSFGGLF